jgi:hypothetical protein
MDYTQIVWLVLGTIAFILAQGFSLASVAPHLAVRDVTFFGGLGKMLASGVAGFAVFLLFWLLGVDPFISAVPAFLAYLGVFALLIRERFGKAVGLWFLSQVVGGFALALLALVVLTVSTFPQQMWWAFAAILVLLCGAGALVWAARASDSEARLGEALLTTLTSVIVCAIWWGLGYYVIGLSGWLVILVFLPIHLLVVKFRLDVAFGRALLVIFGATIGALLLSSAILLWVSRLVVPHLK